MSAAIVVLVAASGVLMLLPSRAVPQTRRGGRSRAGQRRTRAQRRAIAQAWPDAVDTLVSGVRAGQGLPEAAAALAHRGPQALRADFAVFAVEYRATGSMATALQILGERLADPVADRVIAALSLARDVGGSELGPVLRTLSAMLREDARTRAEIAARQCWTVAAARMAVAAPWLTVALLSTRRENLTAYLSPTGLVLLAVAAGLSGLAYLAMMRIGRLPRDERTVA